MLCSCLNKPKIKEHVKSIPEKYGNQFNERPDCYYIECSRQSAYKSVALLDQPKCPTMTVCTQDIKDFQEHLFPRFVPDSIKFVKDSSCVAPSGTVQSASNTNTQDPSKSGNSQSQSGTSTAEDNKTSGMPSYLKWLGGGGIFLCLVCCCCLVILFVFFMMSSSSSGF